MVGRRGVKSDGARGSVARRKVMDAKVALGERGVRWWIEGDEGDGVDDGDEDDDEDDDDKKSDKGDAGNEGDEEDEGDEGDAGKRSSKGNEDDKADGGNEGNEDPRSDKGDKKTENGGSGTVEDGSSKLWWQLPSSQPGLHARIDSTIRALCRARHDKSQHGTICPSEVARCIAGDSTEDWRELMPLVRLRAEGLVKRGQIKITQKGEVVRPGAYRGPIRLRAAAGIDVHDGDGDGDEEDDDGDGDAEVQAGDRGGPVNGEEEEKSEEGDEEEQGEAADAGEGEGEQAAGRTGRKTRISAEGKHGKGRKRKGEDEDGEDDDEEGGDSVKAKKSDGRAKQDTGNNEAAHVEEKASTAKKNNTKGHQAKSRGSKRHLSPEVAATDSLPLRNGKRRR